MPGPEKLVVFDIDGTLTDTNAVDDECFLRAVGEVLGHDCTTFDWNESPHVTDTSLSHWICRQVTGEQPTDHQLREIRRVFIQHLQRSLRADRSRFAEIRGAAAAVAALPAHGWGVAFATGAWEEAARLKLRAAGIPATGRVLASSSDAPTRDVIVRTAIERCERARPSGFAKIVSVGDAPWDLSTARSLGLPFVGVARGARAALLRDAGARQLLADLSSLPTVVAALEHA